MAEVATLWSLAEAPLEGPKRGGGDLYAQASTEGMLFGYASRHLQIHQPPPLWAGIYDDGLPLRSPLEGVTPPPSQGEEDR